jgi:hypothetical protein
MSRPQDGEDPEPGISVAALNLVPRVLWFGLAAYALSVFAAPATRLLNQGQAQAA